VAAVTPTATVHGDAALEGFVARVDAPSTALAAAGDGLPPGEAHAEAVAARRRRAGWHLVPGDPETGPDPKARLRAWGRSSVEIWRADPTLLPELRLGTGHRLRRRPADFWRGVRAAATLDEWLRLTRGYTALLYHRLAGADVPGQERVDVPPALYRRHVRALRRIGFTLLDDDRVLGFHRGERTVPPRATLVTLDDGFRDCVEPLFEAATALLFVPTAAVGGRADWLDEVPVASWPELVRLERAGVRIGSHGRTHARLPSLDDAALGAELSGSLDELRLRLERPSSIFSYPYGDADARVRAAAAAHGYALAYTTEPGRNGLGSDPYGLRRVSVKAWDSTAAIAWKALTGEPLPGFWERWLLRRLAARRRLRRLVRSGRGAAPPSPAPPPPPEP
jgi:peptidoglycan/xylan/chitin deacetylase (PgdA/CDA1 family)